MSGVINFRKARKRVERKLDQKRAAANRMRLVSANPIAI